MSELIRNGAERREKLKQIIRGIENGDDVKRIRSEFANLLKQISPEEIAEAEQALIAEGISAERVKSLCDLHVEAFDNALKRQRTGKSVPGHPVDTYKRENREAGRRSRLFARAASRIRKGIDDGTFSRRLEELKEIRKHYARKENQLFPFLEQVGFTGPSQVMWGKHDEIRTVFREIQDCYIRGDFRGCSVKSKDLVGRIRRMIFMEERILFPTALKKLPESAWAEIARGEHEIGYAWVKPGNLWDANIVASGPAKTRPEVGADAPIDLSIGKLDPKQLDLLLTNLPVDITYVDENDRVRYYTAGAERIFPRSPGIIGRSVQNCHPPKSVATVERILDSFKKGEQKTAEFWLEIEGKFIHIQYIALFDDSNRYRGVIEVSQDITGLRSLTGSKTLLDW